MGDILVNGDLSDVVECIPRAQFIYAGVENLQFMFWDFFNEDFEAGDVLGVNDFCIAGYEVLSDLGKDRQPRDYCGYKVGNC